MQEKVEDLWQRTLSVIKDKVNRPTFQAWIKSLEPVGLQEGVFTLSVPSDFAKDWLEKRYTKVIKHSLENILQQEIDVKFAIRERQPEPKKTQSKPQEHKKAAEIDEFPSIALNSKYTFDNFVVGNSNRFAQAAAFAVAKAPAKAYNPLFIYGGVGLGKTHLMQAVGHYVTENFPSIKSAYISGETFTEHVIRSIREDKVTQFRRKYRNVDVWLVDDIQFIAAKERTEEEFFHTFNALFETNKQIVISSDCRPKDLQLINKRLRSRFESGIIADIKPPELETRVAILQKKAENENLNLPDEVCLYIARKIRDNIRILEGALIKLSAYASLHDLAITLELTEDILKDYSITADQKELTVERIQLVVCEYYLSDLEELMSKRRNKSLVKPRQVAMYFSRKLTNTPLKQIGGKFGGKDHSTVVHAYEKIKELKEKDEKFNSELIEIERRLKG